MIEERPGLSAVRAFRSAYNRRLLAWFIVAVSVFLLVLQVCTMRITFHNLVQVLSSPPWHISVGAALLQRTALLTVFAAHTQAWLVLPRTLSTILLLICMCAFAGALYGLVFVWALRFHHTHVWLRTEDAAIAACTSGALASVLCLRKLPSLEESFLGTDMLPDPLGDLRRSVVAACRRACISALLSTFVLCVLLYLSHSDSRQWWHTSYLAFVVAFSCGFLQCFIHHSLRTVLAQPLNFSKLERMISVSFATSRTRDDGNADATTILVGAMQLGWTDAHRHVQREMEEFSLALPLHMYSSAASFEAHDGLGGDMMLPWQVELERHDKLVRAMLQRVRRTCVYTECVWWNVHSHRLTNVLRLETSAGTRSGAWKAHATGRARTSRFMCVPHACAIFVCTCSAHN
jgi:hypothetical protein